MRCEPCVVEMAHFGLDVCCTVLNSMRRQSTFSLRGVWILVVADGGDDDADGDCVDSIGNDGGVVAVDGIEYALKSSGRSLVVPIPADIANRQWAAKFISQSIFIGPTYTRKH